jgi:hypothetical protein
MGAMKIRFRCRQRQPHHRWLRRVAIFGLVSGWLGMVMLALPLIAHGQTDALAAYGATASGWAIMPFIENDEFQNIPAADEAAPYVYVEIDNSPSADAIAAAIKPGTALGGVIGSQGGSFSGPNELTSTSEARYPGTGTASSQISTFNDGHTSQGAAAAQSASAQEAQAQAQAVVGSYQFVPPTASPPTGLPSLPPLPTVPPLPGTTPSPGGSTPTPTPGGGSPTPTPTPCPLPLPGGGCLVQPLTGYSGGTTGARPLMARMPASPRSYTPAVHLPDLFEQRLMAALRALGLSQPQMLALAGGKPPQLSPNSTVPLAQADGSAEAETMASDNGVAVTVEAHLAKVELLQGLLTFTSVDSTLQAVAPGNGANGQGLITTTLKGANLAGIPITIDQNGVQIACQQAPSKCQGISEQQIQSLSNQLNSTLMATGISITLTKAVTTAGPGKWQGSGGGLEIAGVFNPPSSPVPVPSGVPNPLNNVGTSHVDFSLGKVTANIFAVPNPSINSGSGGFGGLGGGLGGLFGSPGTPGTPGTTGTPGSGSGILGIGSLNPGDLLALLFIVQGFSTAAVAGAASNAEQGSRQARSVPEEESK